ncbi:hypothetical protein [Luteolibacter sp. LG18]|uniref:hypothetical protein n=1 Tax=Luteolibacter sp. LG18 TaxID=2819286 RepID=UPI002B2B0C24|nr:hypothetical protein llg_37330 [Luteolibacter sp. LG18]
MISVGIQDANELVLLLKQIQYAWCAFGKGHSFVENDQDREFNWKCGLKDLQKKVGSRDFSPIPYFCFFEGRFDIEGMGESIALLDLHRWLDLYYGGKLDHYNFNMSLAFGQDGNDASHAGIWFRGAKHSGRNNWLESHVGATATSDASASIVEAVKALGYDKELETYLAQNRRAALFFIASGVPNAALLRPTQEQKVRDALELIGEGARNSDIASCSVSLSVHGVGHFLNMEPSGDLLEYDAQQKKRATSLVSLILKNDFKQKWDFWFNTASEKALTGPLWNRRGSVFEKVDTKAVLGHLKAGKAKYKVILKWKNSTYYLEIQGLGLESKEGQIIAGFGIDFEP